MGRLIAHVATPDEQEKTWFYKRNSIGCLRLNSRQRRASSQQTVFHINVRSRAGNGPENFWDLGIFGAQDPLPGRQGGDGLQERAGDVFDRFPVTRGIVRRSEHEADVIRAGIKWIGKTSSKRRQVV